MNCKRSSRLMATAGLIAASLGYASAATAQPTSVGYRIAAQPLGSALKEVARFNGVQVLFSEQDVAGKVTRGLNGRLTANEAIRQLVAGTGLSVVEASHGVFLIRASASAAIRTTFTRDVPRRSSAQDEAPHAEMPAQAELAGSAEAEVPEEIVVTGVRQSLERAAEIKRNAVQIVDSIVSEDIGKFPDPTTAAALQRVPGVQVSINQNNEVGGVRVRGLDDILTTLGGREIFSTTGRNFSLGDLPAEALSRVDVIKSTTADLVEGGIAGIIDLKLNKPFNFKRPTVVLNARGNYGLYSKKADPQLGILLTDTWSTGIGDIGALVNVTWAKWNYNHPRTREGERRSMAVAPFNLPGVMTSIVAANNVEYGTYERPQANASVQWQANANLMFYADGVYSGYRARDGRSLITANVFPTGASVRDVTVSPDNCITARVAANGLHPAQTVDNRGTADPADDIYSLPPFTVDKLCNLQSGTFSNVITQQDTTSNKVDVDNYIGGFGFEQKADGGLLKGEISYQRSRSIEEILTLGTGQRVPEWQYTASTGNGSVSVTPNGPLASPAGLVLTNGLDQNFTRSVGSLFAGRLDGDFEIEGFLKRVQIGGRYADRSAEFDQALINTPAPGGRLGTATESTAVRVTSLGLPDAFLDYMPPVKLLNGGERGLVPSQYFMRSDAGRDMIRSVYGLAAGDPTYQPQRRFEASERTFAFYLEGFYEASLGSGMTLDGAVGVRPTRTEREIAGSSVVTIPASGGQPSRTSIIPVNATSTDVDVLPNASARLQFGGGLQLRGVYSKAIRRPGFAALNPGVSYSLSTNPNLRNSGSSGNPDLRPQKSENFDASLEYFFGRGFLSVAVYKRNIIDRVITSTTAEDIDGISYNISRPRNVGSADLKGLEVSGQAFFDFLPGALSGLGVFGNVTIADTEVTGNDRLAGLPLLGVSKYNYNVGLLYDKYGLSGRLVYTYRSKYYDNDETGSTSLRAVDPERALDPTYNPLFLNYVRPAGRLDLGISYDATRSLRFDLGATNLLRSKYRGYYNQEFWGNQYRFDETTISLGARVRL